MTHPTATPVSHTSADLTAERLDALRDLIPEAFTEGKVDFAKLRAALGDLVDDRPERYSFTWAGKRDAIRLLQTPTRATLVPAKDESVNWDTTQNLFIEGDNLEVLKLLYKAYYGRVKLIYIDPPYNRGKDFIYPDDYADPLRPYLQLTGQMDAAGNLLTSNTEASGRYHSAWLNMMYPRLFVARQLLTEDGSIFVSIGEQEVHNLRALMSELFGEENFVATVVWQKSKRGDAKLIAQTHDYVLVFAKNKDAIIQNGAWRIAKPGVDEVLTQYQRLRTIHKNNHEQISEAMRKWYSELPRDDPRRAHMHYRNSDERGLYFTDNFAGPDDGRTSRPRYDIIHPVTGRPCKKPSTGWRWDEERTKRALAANPPLIHFGSDETTIPCRKTYLITTLGQPFASVFYRDGRSATLELETILGSSLMDFPKNPEVLQDFVRLASDTDSVVMDFFAGSASMAQAVMQQNTEDDGNRRFIMVQLPEPTGDRKYPTISDIGKSRVRYQSAKLNTGGAEQQDRGFRIFKLSPSHFTNWSGTASAIPADYHRQLEAFTDPLTQRHDAEAVIWEVAIKEGYALTSRVEAAAVAGHVVYRVSDPDRSQHFHICLDDEVAPALAVALGLGKEDLFVCRDLALDDSAAANLALQCRLKTI
jgi:adenine-specific DNA-methyltransferase